MTGSEKLRKENQSFRNEIAELKENLQKTNLILASGFKGERIVALSGLRQCIFDKVQANQLGVKICLRRARKAFYRPGSYEQIPEYISRCSISDSHKLT